MNHATQEQTSQPVTEQINTEASNNGHDDNIQVLPDSTFVVRRRDRGLSVAGTRTTIYAVMEFLKLGYPPHEAAARNNITDEQMAGVLEYIDAHRAEVEAEYEQVIQQAEENRRYHEEEWRKRQASLPPRPPDTPLQALVRAKLTAEKARLGME